jgi:hypothetical protein
LQRELKMKVTTPAAAQQPCRRQAVYTSPTGAPIRLPIPDGFSPQGMISHHGVTRVLIAEIDANDPRTDQQILDDELAQRPDMPLSFFGSTLSSMREALR